MYLLQSVIKLFLLFTKRVAVHTVIDLVVRLHVVVAAVGAEEVAVAGAACTQSCRLRIRSCWKTTTFMFSINSLEKQVDVFEG